MNKKPVHPPPQQKKIIMRQDSMNSQHSQNSQQSTRSFRQKDPILENSAIHIDSSQKDKHTKFTLSNKLDVYFPYKPYDVQVVYMESVVKCLETKQNGLLESPTGTGKTLSLLCASLAWLQKKREQNLGSKEVIPNRIIYCSRTHSQIQQVVKELKRTIYQPRILVQGSREQCCIKKEFEMLKGGILNSACQKAISQLNTQSYCKFFKGSMDEGRDLFKLKMPDIEDLKMDGYNNNYCPFYHSQRINNAVDVLFLPYNYLLDRNVTNVANINIKNAVIIFDEAHNIHKSAEEGYSLFLNYSSLCAAETDLLNLIKYINRGFIDESYANTTQGKRATPIKSLSEFDTKNFNSCSFDCRAMLGPVQEFKHFFKSKLIKQKPGQVDFNLDGNNLNVKEGKEIFEWIQIHTRSLKDKVDQEGVNKYMKALEKEKGGDHNSFENGINLNNLHFYIEKANIAIKDLSLGASHFGLETWVKFLEGLLDLWLSHHQWKLKARRFDNPTQFYHDTDVMQDYKLYFDSEDIDNPQLHLACLNPSLNFRKILSQEPHCILFTSGTLKPFDFWKSELQIPFDITLENKHVIDSKKQLFSVIIKGRPKTTSSYTQYRSNFNFSYEKRKDQEMLLDLGEALAELFNVIPNGVLVVFPSNQLMDQCRQQWASNSSSENNAVSTQRIYNRLLTAKNLYWEVKNSQETLNAMADYKLKSKTERGAAFFCVARGKITEGIDFSDEYARAVILVGLPYPPLKNIKIQVKRDYLNELQKGNAQRLSGNDWYVQEAIRAMNQSIGRVIRHINDWGSIIFLDERFNQPDIIKSVPSWCQTETIETFDQALIQTSTFFNERRAVLRQSQDELRRQIQAKRKEQEEAERKEQTQQNNLFKGNEVQRRVFDFSQNKTSSNLLKQRKYFKQNILVSEDKDNEKQVMNKSVRNMSNSHIVSALSDDEESSQEQLIGLNPLDKHNTVKISNQKEDSITQGIDNTTFKSSKSLDRMMNSFNNQKTLSKNSNVMSLKNSLYTNKNFFEY